MVGERLDVIVSMQKNERLYTFNIPYGVKYEDVYVVLDDLKIHMQNMEKKAVEAQEKAKAEAEAAPIEAEVSNG